MTGDENENKLYPDTDLSNWKVISYPGDMQEIEVGGVKVLVKPTRIVLKPNSVSTSAASQ